MISWSMPWEFFTDPVLRGPTLGCMLMCLAGGLVGVLVFLRKQSLLGESLSHASYPGVILGAMIAGFLEISETNEGVVSLLIIGGAFLTALGGLWGIHYLETRLKIRSDSALCFILALFFGIGLTLASHIQFSFPRLYRQSQAYLYGQAATMTDIHIVIYGILSLIIVLMIFVFRKELETIIFDRTYAKSLGMKVTLLDGMFFVLIVAAVVIGIRSVGVILMSAMIIAPAVSARQFTNRFNQMFKLSALFGLLSAFLGNYFSVEFARQSDLKLALPTGPMIVVVSTILCLFALLFAPERGLVLRNLRILKFRFQCQKENLLKTFWYLDEGQHQAHPFDKIIRYHHFYPLYLYFLLWKLRRQGLIYKIAGSKYGLTERGLQKVSKIIRLHRLWEVYLVDYLGVGVERVHKNAEEMEHILTPEIEKELTKFLKDPKTDPHHQPIPPEV